MFVSAFASASSQEVDPLLPLAKDPFSSPFSQEKPLPPIQSFDQHVSSACDGKTISSDDDEDEEEEEGEEKEQPTKKRKMSFSSSSFSFASSPTQETLDKMKEFLLKHTKPTAYNSARPVLPKPLVPTFNNILNLPPTDDNATVMDEFLIKYGNLKNVEIECRLGVITSSSTKQSFVDNNLSVLSPLPSSNNTYFDTNVPPNYFAHLKDMVLKQQINKFTKTVDTKHKSGIRVTQGDSDKPTNCVIKTKLCDLDFYNPRANMDFRLSASTEVLCGAPHSSDTVVSTRIKERNSYGFEFWSLDLTKVTVQNHLDKKTSVVIYQVELEIKDKKYLSGMVEKKNTRNIALNMLDNIKSIAKSCGSSQSRHQRNQ